MLNKIDKSVDYDFPVKTVDIQITEEIPESLPSSFFSRPFLEVTENDFLLKVRNVAHYRVQDGTRVSIKPMEDTDDESVRLFLHGSALGALLHQKGVLPLHGSSFKYHDKVVMVCGNSGLGKSSVTEAFCQNGAQFISDDISPLEISEKGIVILPLKTRNKLWDDALRKLKIESKGLEKIRPEFDKFYTPPRMPIEGEQLLDHIFILKKHNKPEFKINELEGLAKYNILRKQIYRKVYLKGMPATERKYFQQLLLLANKVRVTVIVRPDICDIYETREQIRKEIEP